MNYDIQEGVFYVFTDGASRSVFNKEMLKKTGRHGGKGVRCVYYDEKLNLIEEDASDYISYTQATNQDMELHAAIDGLRIIKDRGLGGFKKAIIVTDSTFIYENRSHAVFRHRDKPGVGWKTKFGDPVIHKKEWKKLTKYWQEIYSSDKKQVEFERVKALHKKNNGSRTQYNDYNDKADTSAVKGAQSPLRVRGVNITTIRSPFFADNKRLKEGFIPLQGETVFIHICNSKYIRMNRYRYNYELVSWEHDYFKQVGWIYYNQKTLSAKKIYLVKIKSDGSNQIEEIISEHTKEEIKEKMIAEGIDTSILFGKLGIQ